MALFQVDRDVNYMKEMWGTTSLITDYSSPKKKVLQEIMHDRPADAENLNEEESETEIFKPQN
jgi:hypothetical protein